MFSQQLGSNTYGEINRHHYDNELDFIKLYVDKAIQTFQNNSTKDSVLQLRAVYSELSAIHNNINSKNNTTDIDRLAFLLGHTIRLLLLSEKNTNNVTNTNSITYLNGLEEELGHYLHFGSLKTKENLTDGLTNITSLPNEQFLEYVNEPYGLKVQYPYDWIIRIDNNYSLPSQFTYAHPRIIGSFYLPNSTLGLPFFYLGINLNLSKQFKQYPFTLQHYLDESLQSKKNSSAFPDFKLIEATIANNSNNLTLAGLPAYEIVWTYEHPVYGMRELMELGTVVQGSKGYFVDYAASIDTFSKYLPIAQDMKGSFKISNIVSAR